MLKRKIPYSIYYILAILLVLFFLDRIGAVRWTRRKVEAGLIIPAKENLFRWQRSLKKDLNGCALSGESQVAELKAKLLTLQKENEDQKRLLSLQLPKDWKFIEAKVIEVSGETLVLNAGKQNGVKEGMTLIFGNTYLGKVFSISENMSIVRLPSFLEEKSVAFVVLEGKDKVTVGRGLLVGIGEGKMRLEQIFLSENVKKNDLVQINSNGGDLLVGKIDEISEKQGEVFKGAMVKTLYNPEELGTVFLINGRI